MSKWANDHGRGQELTVAVILGTAQACSAGTPPELLNIAPSATESLYNIVDVVAEVVDVDDVVET